MEYEELQEIVLKDGRTVTILLSFNGGEAYLVEEYTPDKEFLYTQDTIYRDMIAGKSGTQ